MNSDNKSNHPNQMNDSTTTETTTRKRKQNTIHDGTYYSDCIPSSSSLSSTTTQSNNTPIQSMQHNTLLFLLDTWDGEKSVHYWFSIVLIQGLFKLPLCDLKQYTLVCKSISKLVRDHIQRNFWFQQHDSYDYKQGERDDVEKRYLWYSPHRFKNVKNVSTLPINTTKIQFFQMFNSLPTFPIHLQQVTRITFEFKFNQPIGCGIKSEINNLPLTLTHLTLSSYFNQSVDDLPPNLTNLQFSQYFNKSVNNLPSNLKKLSFGSYFNKPVDNLPPNLTHLSFEYFFNQNINKLPLSLTHLTFISYSVVDFDQPLDQLQRNFESNLEYLILSALFLQKYDSSIPPNFIRLGESEQYEYKHIVYKKQQQQQ